MDEIEVMLKELTEASGVSGYETGARAVMKKYFSGLGELSQDNLGSLMCTKTGTAASPRVLIAGHMDELGFMVKHITKSEKKLGHSKKEAENIAWATANKRGMLDNKNKKK